MRKLLLVSAFLFPFTWAAPASAQDRAKPELFVGYSFESVDSGIKSGDLRGTDIARTSLEDRFNLNGFNVSATGYVTKRFGLAGDFSAGFKSRRDSFDTIQVRSKLSLYNVTAGPQVKFFGAGRVVPSLHALFGVSRRSLKVTAVDTSTSPLATVSDSTTSFTMNIGGGLDTRLNDRVDFRIVQVDYNPIFIRGRRIEDVDFPGRTLHGVRISVGFVIR